MHIEEFAVEIWMNRYENNCRLNLAETCVKSLTVAELLALAGKPNDFLDTLLSMKLTYGAIEGSDRLRSAIASLYATRTADEVVVTHGAIGANSLVYSALIEPGDRVVSIVPAYQQHVSIPKSLGAEVRELRLRRQDNYAPDLDALRDLVGEEAKLIVFSNPNNPTGALMDRETLEEIVRIAAKAGAWILADEVYRGTDQEGEGSTVSVADLYDRAICVGSMSKAYSLAGLRLGWITARRDFLAKVSIHRDYNTISVGMIDDFLASLALESRHAILERSHRITRENLSILSDWMAQEPSMSWVRPRSGTIALLDYNRPIASQEFCARILEETGVLFTPGSAFGEEGSLRIGFANNTQDLREGLAEFSRFLART